MTTQGPLQPARISQHEWNDLLERVEGAPTPEQLGKLMRELSETKAAALRAESEAKTSASIARQIFNRLGSMDKTVADLKEWREDSAVIEIAALRGKVRRNDKGMERLNYALVILLAGALLKVFLHQ